MLGKSLTLTLTCAGNWRHWSEQATCQILVLSSVFKDKLLGSEHIYNQNSDKYNLRCIVSQLVYNCTLKYIYFNFYQRFIKISIVSHTHTMKTCVSAPWTATDFGPLEKMTERI